MKTISTLQKEAKKAAKFILVAFNKTTGGYVYVSNTLGITDNIKHAMKYSIGFDDEAIKAKAMSLSTGYEFTAINA